MEQQQVSEEESQTLMDKLLTPQEMADCLGVKVSTIYQWTHQEFIPHIKIGKLVRFKEQDVSEWIDRKMTKGRASRKIDIKELLSIGRNKSKVGVT